MSDSFEITPTPSRLQNLMHMRRSKVIIIFNPVIQFYIESCLGILTSNGHAVLDSGTFSVFSPHVQAQMESSGLKS